jgi:glycosyltransferase involved in cell wall biosynthesis
MASIKAAARSGAHDLSVFPESLRGKRILVCTESFGPVNGVSRTTLMLVTHLRRHGAIVAVAAPQNHTKQNIFIPLAQDAKPGVQAAEVKPLLKCSEDGNIEMRLRGYPLPYNPELSIVYPVRLSAMYASTFGAPPDLIYLASPASLGFQVMLQLRQQPRERQVPVIANFQTDLGGYCAILFPPPLSDFAVYTFAVVESFLFRHPSIKTIFYPSRFVRRYLEKHGVQGNKMSVLRRGVNTDLFNPSRRSDALRGQMAPGGETIFVCVARLAGEKGFEFLARVATELDARGLRFRLLVVGGNRNADVEQEIRELFRPLSARGVVTFAGLRVGEDLAAHYASADVFLHCSITETFGLVVLESMASGVPVVARDEGGPSDIVINGETGYLVPHEDLNQFVDKAIALAHDAVLRRRMSEAGRRVACEATWEKIGNTVAWRMAELIDERERERELACAKADDDTPGSPTTPTGLVSAQTPVLGWLFLSDALRARLADSRLLGALAIILGFWGAVGFYLVFINAAFWIKSRVRA